jgi:hypothetical protein
VGQEIQRTCPGLIWSKRSSSRSNASRPALPALDQAGADSDLDLLIDLPPNTGLLERIALKLALEDTLHSRVDLLRRRNLRPTVLATAEQDAIPL